MHAHTLSLALFFLAALWLAGCVAAGRLYWASFVARCIFSLKKSRTVFVCTGSTYFRPHRTGERKRKSIRGCIVGADLAVLNLVVVRKGENDVPGLTDADSARPNRLGPKRASHIRKLFVRDVLTPSLPPTLTRYIHAHTLPVPTPFCCPPPLGW